MTSIIYESNNYRVLLHEEERLDVGSVLSKTYSFTNPTAAEFDLMNGTILGRVAATGKVVPLDILGTDGSQIPFGFVKNPACNSLGYRFLASETANVSVVISASQFGGILEKKAIFPSSVTKDTPIVSLFQTVEDALRTRTGIVMISNYDITI